MGANPAEVRTGTLKGLHVLGREQDVAFELLHSLDATQRQRTHIATASLGDIVSGPGRYVRGIREAGMDQLHFAWAGALQPGHAHDYRVHGPTVLIEYDNTQHDANHIHTVWHDPRHDFGLDLLQAHYNTGHRRHD